MSTVPVVLVDNADNPLGALEMRAFVNALAEYFQNERISARNGLEYRQICETGAGVVLNALADGGDERL